MKYFILALMSVMYNDPATNDRLNQFYVFYTPHFYSIEDCKEYARANQDLLYYKIYQEYGAENPVHMISCVDEGVIKTILKGEQKT